MPKRKARSQTTNLTPNHKKLGISPIYLHAGGVPHTFEKLSMRATTFLETSPQLEVCIQYYGPLKLQEAQFQEFRDSPLGVLGQNDIWVLAPWLGIENIVRGEVVASPKSKSWWVLWIHVRPLLIRAPKVQLCTNQLVVWFMQVLGNNWFAYHSSQSLS